MSACQDVENTVKDKYVNLSSLEKLAGVDFDKEKLPKELLTSMKGVPALLLQQSVTFLRSIGSVADVLQVLRDQAYQATVFPPYTGLQCVEKESKPYFCLKA
eukprot:1204935-Amphidinium_carterae.1